MDNSLSSAINTNGPIGSVDTNNMPFIFRYEWTQFLHLKIGPQKSEKLRLLANCSEGSEQLAAEKETLTSRYFFSSLLSFSTWQHHLCYHLLLAIFICVIICFYLYHRLWYHMPLLIIISIIICYLSSSSVLLSATYYIICVGICNLFMIICIIIHYKTTSKLVRSECSSCRVRECKFSYPNCSSWKNRILTSKAFHKIHDLFLHSHKYLQCLIFPCCISFIIICFYDISVVSINIICPLILCSYSKPFQFCTCWINYRI